VSPEFSKTTQTRLIPALAAIHNFRQLNNDIDEEDWDPSSEDGSNSLDPLLLPVAEPFKECDSPLGLTADDLSAGITAEETAMADAHRDEIAARMWDSYQIYIAQM
jgi:hypothetical protein